MKSLKTLYLLLFVLALTSCSKDEVTDEVEETSSQDCLLTAENTFFDPICEGYTPYPDSPLQFPLVVISSELDDLPYDDYSFSWSHSESQASAIGFWYEDLPLSVTVTELATDCEVTIEIGLEYWD